MSTTLSLLPALAVATAEALAELCRAHRVRHLDLFGSATSERFDPVRSDLDFLVAFTDESTPGDFDDFLALQGGLERLFRRKVDLLGDRFFHNPYFRKQVESERLRIFTAS